LNFKHYKLKYIYFIGWHNELFNDKYGKRIGFKGRIYETTVSWNHWLAKKNVGFRPETRFDEHLDDETPFNSGNKKSQRLAQMDMLVRF